MHLEWIYSRMIEQHNENPNVDYMIRFRKIFRQDDKIKAQHKSKNKLKNNH